MHTHGHIHTARKGCHISRLPTEILCDIFLNYLNIPSQDAPNNAATPNWELLWHHKAPYVSEYSVSDPGVLTQVCSAWRKAALGYPALWSRLLIIGPLSKLHVKMMDLWLERADGHCLDLTFKVVTLKPNNPLAIDVLQSFFAHSEAWRRITLEVDWPLLDLMSDLTESSAPCVNLEFAGFAIPDWWPHHRTFPVVENIWKFFYSSPLLKKIVLPPLNNDALLPHTPTTQLVSVILWSYGTIADLLLVIRCCPLLEEVQTKQMEEVSRPGTFTQDPITHQTLQRLIIAAAPAADLDKFFGAITLPSLKSLGLTCTTPQLSAFSRFLRRSDCQLQELTLGIGGELESYIRLEELSTLTVFRVTKAAVTDGAVELLLERRRESSGGFRFLPHLRVLHLSDWQASDGMLSRFFAARSCVPVKLGDYMTMVLPDETRPSVPSLSGPEPVQGQVAFSFFPLPDGPIDSGFLKRNYQWLSEVYKWITLCKMLRAVCLR